MRIKQPWFKNQQITQFISLFKVNMSEAQQANICEFRDFNHFFTRELKKEARIDQTREDELCCPVDGAVSEIGKIENNQLIQAKGHYFHLNDLLAGNELLTETFLDGSFATIYLSPKDYHRIHMPIKGTLKTMFHVPGDLFGVNRASVKAIPNLFARNERVISIYDTPAGSMALIQVGAIFVSSIETSWHGVVTPPRHKTVRSWQYQDEVKLEKAQEMGRFNMGSTVILLFSKNKISWANHLIAEAPVQMGQLLGSVNHQ